MKKIVVFKYDEVPCFGGPPKHSLKFTTGNMVKDDVDIIQNNGSIEHGFRFENIDSVGCELSKVADIGDVIKKLETIVCGLKEIRDEQDQKKEMVQ